ncbi:hypothetical protein LXL04_001559 [Taraxacum kok-saghyz]
MVGFPSLYLPISRLWKSIRNQLKLGFVLQLDRILPFRFILLLSIHLQGYGFGLCCRSTLQREFGLCCRSTLQRFILQVSYFSNSKGIRSLLSIDASNRVYFGGKMVQLLQITSLYLQYEKHNYTDRKVDVAFSFGRMQISGNQSIWGQFGLLTNSAVLKQYHCVHIKQNQEHQINDQCKHVMTAYKLVTLDAPYWGFGSRLEQALIAVLHMEGCFTSQQPAFSDQGAVWSFSGFLCDVAAAGKVDRNE